MTSWTIQNLTFKNVQNSLVHYLSPCWIYIFTFLFVKIFFLVHAELAINTYSHDPNSVHPKSEQIQKPDLTCLAFELQKVSKYQYLDAWVLNICQKDTIFCHLKTWQVWYLDHDCISICKAFLVWKMLLIYDSCH